MSEKLYYRPVLHHGRSLLKSSKTLAKGWTFFDQVEVLSRSASPYFISASDLPKEQLEKLITPRASIAGLQFSERPNLMGVLNVTPDSFSDGGEFENLQDAVEHALDMSASGADILDIGGESTRPGAVLVPESGEIARVTPIIAAIRSHLQIPISIDTRKSNVAASAINAGATMINDVYAFEYDPKMLDVAVDLQVPICVMHAQGAPDVMQNDPRYDNVVLDVYDFLEAKIQNLVRAGFDHTQIIVDPGIGFGKTLEQNLALLSNLSLFHSLGCPVLLGASRKSFIGHITGQDDPLMRLGGSLATAIHAAQQGVQILRVHDIPETHQALQVWSKISQGA